MSIHNTDDTFVTVHGSRDRGGEVVVTEYPAQPERTANGFIRVSKPGDADYDGICTPE